MVEKRGGAWCGGDVFGGHGGRYRKGELAGPVGWLGGLDGRARCLCPGLNSTDRTRAWMILTAR
jgi:hypothetical protein